MICGYEVLWVFIGIVCGLLVVVVDLCNLGELWFLSFMFFEVCFDLLFWSVLENFLEFMFEVEFDL